MCKTLKTLIVEKKFDNKKLIAFLTYKFPITSQNTFYKALRKKDIRINNIKVSENTIIHEGDEIKLFISDEYINNTSSIIKPIYEDENILIVNKPKQIEVTGENSLTSILKLKNENIFPCHRLDRNTSRTCNFCKIK